jgi:glyoxylase-like metal-dependent hydrolase (beta-lactamase superfamily II)
MDHIGSLAFLKKATGAKVVASIKESDYIKGMKKTWTMGREGFAGKLFKVMLFFMETFAAKLEPGSVDILCKGGEVIDSFGGLKVIPAPGHSPGSLCYYQEKKGLLFAGDALTGFQGLKFPLRTGCADYQEAIRSAKKISELDFEKCFFGHGEPVLNNAREMLRTLTH